MFTGLLAGAFEGLASGVGSVADSEIKAQADARKSAAENAEYDRRLQVAMDRKLAQEQINAKRDALAYENAENRASTTGDDRRFAKFKQDAGAVDVPDGQLRQVFDQYYNQQTVAGGDKNASRYVEPGSTREKDVLDSLVKEGASGALIKKQRESYKTTLSGEAKVREDARKETEAERKERLVSAQIDALTKNSDSNRIRAEAAQTRAERGPSGGSGSKDKPATTADLNRKLINAKEGMAEAMGVKTADVIRKLADLKQRADAGEKAAQQKMADLEPYRKLYRLASEELQNFKRTEEPEPSKPVAAQPKSSATTRPPLSSFMKN